MRTRNFKEPAKLDNTKPPGNWSAAFKDAQHFLTKNGVCGRKHAARKQDLVGKVFLDWVNFATTELATWSAAAEKATGVIRRHVLGQYLIVMNSVLWTPGFQTKRMPSGTGSPACSRRLAHC